tara:strand:- start:467 stop:1099 length:633 start_codon:yes stop_codon:yes gene_type:complete
MKNTYGANNNSAIKTFDIWAQQGKDEGMAKAHESSVDEMLSFSMGGLKKDFKFIDAGCGNGWVVRKVRGESNCNYAIGIDGSISMIKKAREIDPAGEYICADLLNWKPESKVDLVHTMEVLYYFEDPMLILKKLYNDWVLPGGRLICGVDYYFENLDSHSWQKDLGVVMTLLSNREWSDAFIKTGFRDVKTWISQSKGNQNGTLILTGIV